MRFVDRQISGPFSVGSTRTRSRAGHGGTLIRDLVVYRMPLGPLGEIARRALIGRDLERIFDYRRDAIARLMGSPEET